MLDLDSGVHLQEEVLALAREQALDRARGAVADGAGRVHGDARRSGPELVVDRRRGRFLDELLVAALDRALALAEVDDGAVRVGEHLHLDVARILQVALDVDGCVREVRLALSPGRLEGALDLVGGLDDLQALAAPAGRGLDRDRPAELVAEPPDLVRRLDAARSCPG